MHFDVFIEICPKLGLEIIIKIVVAPSFLLKKGQLTSMYYFCTNV